jgi:hypothetical protein
MRPKVCLVVPVVLALATGSHAAPRHHCFDVTVSANTPSTRAVFSQRHCQGGGVTWAGLLQVLARRMGRVVPLDDEQAPGWTGAVSTLGGAHFSVDDEGDAAQFCSDDAELMKKIRDGYERLNRDGAELRRAMSETSALELECLEADGGVPAMPPPFPSPQLPAAEVARNRSAAERLKQTLRAQPIWCFAPGNLEKASGALRFLPDGTLLNTRSKSDATVLHRGHWSLPVDPDLDPRLQLDTPRLLHLDVGASGNLGFNWIYPDKTVREELLPAARCP